MPSNIDFNYPQYISYVITSKCVANCEICLTPTDDLRGINDLCTNDAKIIIDKIADSNVNMISFAGREPFMREDIWELIEYTKKKRLAINLESTSVTLNENDIDRLINLKVDWLSMTVDTFDRSLSQKMKRPYVSKEHLNMLCQKFSQSSNSHLKISSVVSKITLTEMNEIGAFLEKCPPEIWKLRQFTIRGGGEKDEVRNKYYLENDLFLNEFKLLKKQHPNIYITTSSKDDYTGALLMITPSGDVILPFGRSNIMIGRLIKDNINLRDVWINKFSEKNKQMHAINYVKSYLTPIN